MSKFLEELRDQLLAQGYDEGTPRYEREYRRMKVLKCRDMRDLPYCSKCVIYMDCELIKAHLRDVRLGDGNGPKQPPGK